MLRRALLALALAVPVAPAFAQDPPKPDAPVPVPTPAPAPAAPAETDDQVLERITGEMAKKVEEIRGLKFKKEVKRVWKSRDEAKKEMLADIDRELPPEKIAAENAMMAFFGLIPEGADLKEIFADFISAGAGGYYKPDTDVFSLVRGFKEDASRPIVFHELIHAVEDQYYDFETRQKKHQEADLGDHATAIQGLVEGSARYFEDRFVDSEPGLRMKYFKAQQEAEGMEESAAKIQSLPPAIVVAMVMYPYGNGSRFLDAVVPVLQERKVADPFGALYADPPVSTEQILHPSKYLDPDLPREVRLPDLAPVLGEGWKVLSRGTHGELGIGLIINAAVVPYTMMAQGQSLVKPPAGMLKSPEDQARFMMNLSVEFKGVAAKAATGWDGDRYMLLKNGEKVVLAWATAWDSATEADEFAEGYGKTLNSRYGTVTEEKSETGKVKKVRTPPESAPFEAAGWTGTRWPKTRDGETAVLRSGDRVIVLERAPSGSLEKLAAALAKAEVVQDAKDTVPAAKK
jgi:hypothetical protein